MMRWRNHRLAISLLCQQILVFYWFLSASAESVAKLERPMDEHSLMANQTYEPKQNETRVLFGKNVDENKALDFKIDTESVNLNNVSDEERDSSTSANVARTSHGQNNSIQSNNETFTTVLETRNTSQETSTSIPSTLIITTVSYSHTVRISHKSPNVSHSLAEEPSITSNATVASGVGTNSNKTASDSSVIVSHHNRNYKELLTNSDALSSWENARHNSSSSSMSATEKIPNTIETLQEKSSQLLPGSNVSNVDQQVRSATNKETLPEFPDIVTNRTKMKNITTEISTRNTSSFVSLTTEQVRLGNVTEDIIGTPSNIVKSFTSTNSESSVDTARSSSIGSEAVASEMYATSNPTVENMQAQGDLLGAGAIVGIIFGVLGVVVLVGGVFGYLIYHRRFRPLSEIKYPTDNCGYVDDTLRVSYINNHIELPKENSEEMFSLDNDSFLNSLEAMTLQNYWAEDAKNTKV